MQNASYGPRYYGLGTRDTERRNIPFLSSVYLQSVESRCKTVGWVNMDQKKQLLFFHLIFLSIIDFFLLQWELIYSFDCLFKGLYQSTFSAKCKVNANKHVF